MARNTDLIYKKFAMNIGLFVVVVSVGLIVFQRFGDALSCILGAGCSYTIFDQLVKSQEQILETKKRSLFFPRFMIRLALYAVPVGIVLFFEQKLNLYLMLVFLFSFQGFYVLFELCRSYKKVRRKKWIS